MSCARPNTGEAASQPFPRTGRLKKTLNANLSTLRRRLRSQTGEAYCYVVKSVEWQNDRFVQTGSGPNFQGGFITLCTCKHQMRSRRDIYTWPGQWVAGFTGVNAVDRGNYLVYLMMVGDAYASHQELWSSRALPARAKRDKAAHLHRLGDLYQPASSSGDPLDPRSYMTPRADHSHTHGNKWHTDIDYGRRQPAALLVGHHEDSFLWDRPTLRLPWKLSRNYTIRNLPHLLNQLEDVRTR